MSHPWQETKKYKQALDHSWIEIRQTDKGRGIFSLVDHKKGDLVAAFVGEPITIPVFATEEEADVFSHSKDAEYTMSYKTTPDGFLAIRPDPDKIGGHIANHSCRPNTTITEKYRDADALMMRAVRPIRAGDEITIDYHWHRRVPIPCLCGSDPCTGNIGLTYTIVHAPSEDGSIQSYFKFDRSQVIKLLQVAEAHKHLDALRVLKVRGNWIPAERLREYFEQAFGRHFQSTWLTQNFHKLASATYLG